MGKFAKPVGRKHPLRFEIQYTADQLIKVELYDDVTGQLLTEIEIKHTGMLSEDEHENARNFLQQAEVS